MQAGFFDYRMCIPWSIASVPARSPGQGRAAAALLRLQLRRGAEIFMDFSLFTRRNEQVKGGHAMKTMQTIIMEESKDRACAAVWHQGRQADFRETSKGFSQDNDSKSNHGKGAF